MGSYSKITIAELVAAHVVCTRAPRVTSDATDSPPNGSDEKPG